MKKLYTYSLLIALAVLAAPHTILAQDGSLGDGLGEFLQTLAAFFFGPLLTFLLALAFIIFAWGVIKYFISDAEGDKASAKSLMIWGILGFVLILILFGAVNLLVEFTGLGEGELKKIPGIEQIKN